MTGALAEILGAGLAQPGNRVDEASGPGMSGPNSARTRIWWRACSARRACARTSPCM